MRKRAIDKIQDGLRVLQRQSSSRPRISVVLRSLRRRGRDVVPTVPRTQARSLKSVKTSPACMLARATGTLHFSLIPKEDRVQTRVQSDTLVCASLVTKPGMLIQRLEGQHFVLEIVRMDALRARRLPPTIKLLREVRRGDVLIIENNKPKIRKDTTFSTLRRGRWEISWMKERLFAVDLSRP